ncbi:AraC family transcriptional regulator [Dyadobacter sp. CY351]|uniref:helix-turn-helix domain-containing protein n=1 Tax=Dyadobacter sp. CY351 TaxID=2909337 RepID=UPI001F3CC18D|nr:helix-turn-helix domain-containing protein [Dyadobacter sp. CY351]MCF2518785.1 helix-turn-helix domain-containing protein [Dyadobacter sp. CY351]
MQTDLTEPLEILMLTADYFKNRADVKEEFVEIIWIKGGNCKLLSCSEVYTISAKNSLLLKPGRSINLEQAFKLDGLVIRFQAEMLPVDFKFTSAYSSNLVSRIYEIGELSAEGIGSVIECMQWELKHSTGSKIEVLSAYLRIVLIYLSKQKSIVLGPDIKSDAVLAIRFFSLLESKYLEFKKVSDYADALAVTPNYLNKVIKRETGLSAGANIRERLIRQAKQMAAAQNANLKNIAYKLGFNDAAHFSKYFKASCGCNFTTYVKTKPLRNEAYI